jgi:glycosyltransferase involved in cell wall biosynthesis
MQVVHIPKSTGHSLSKINRDIATSLKGKFLFQDTPTADIFVQHYISQIPRNNSYKKKILIQPVDGTKIISSYVEKMNQYDLVIAPATASKRILEREGVKTLIKIIPNYYDEEIFLQDSSFFQDRYKEKKYTFYSETTGIKRKNVDNILKHFLDEFSGTPDASKVRLILKLSSGDNLKMKKLKSILDSYTNPPEVDIYNKWLEDSDLNSLRRNIDCYVALSYMEGFCIPLMNAAVLKKDIIALDTRISGYSDFLDRNNALLLRPKTIPIDTLHESLLIYGRDSQWEEPDYAEYREALRKIYLREYNFMKNRDYSRFSRASVMREYEKAIEIKEKFFCISQEKQEDDYLITKKELSKLGVDQLTRFIPTKQSPRILIKRPDLSKLSSAHYELENHLQLLKKCLSLREEYFCIFEDDVVVLESKNLEEIVKSAPNDWDVIFFGGMNHYDSPTIVNELFYRSNFSFNSHAYAVKASFLETLVKEVEKREYEVDVIFAHMQRAKIGNWYGLRKDFAVPDGRKKQRFIKILHESPVISPQKLKNVEVSFISVHPKIKGIKYYCMRGSSGYAEAAKDYIIGLNSHVPVSVEFLVADQSSYFAGERNRKVSFLQNKKVQNDVTIVHTVPDRWVERFDWNPGSLKVGMTVWETDRVPTDWIPWIQKADKIIVPCEWNKRIFEESGITKPIGVVPHIYKEVSPETYRMRELESNPFIFYTIGQWTERKGLGDTIRAYLKAFSEEDNVILIVKAFGSNYEKTEQEKILDRVKKITEECKNPARVKVITEQMRDSQISYLHNIGHCYISLCKAEGFGLGMFEAAGKGKPVVTTGHGGQLDFLVGPFVDFKICPVNMEYTWYTKDHNWAYPDTDHAAKILRNVHENYDTYLLAAQENSLRIKEDFSYEVVTQKLIDFIK